MSTVAEDPVALRGTAAQLRREAEIVVSQALAATQRAAAMTYAGPAADAFRHGMGAAGTTAAQVANRLLELATWLDQCAASAEAEIAARRAAGLP